MKQKKKDINDSEISSPNSEDIIESERKLGIEGKSRCAAESRMLVLKSQLGREVRREDPNETINDQNISNVEEFLNDLEFQAKHEKFQNTQRVTTRRDLIEDIHSNENESLKMSLTKPLHK